MADWSIESNDAFRVAAELTQAGFRAGVRAFSVTRMYGQLVNTAVQANASGRPGPRAITGDYRRSIATHAGYDGGSVFADVGTNKAQGRRLEFGFFGKDSLGRRFRQAPRPHFGPALDRFELPYEEAIAALVEDI